MSTWSDPGPSGPRAQAAPVEQTLMKLLGVAGLGFLHIDRTNRIIGANTRASTLLDRPVIELPGTGLDEHVSDGDRPELLELLDSAREHGTAEHHGLHFGRGRVVRHLSVTAVSVPADDAEVGLLVAPAAPRLAGAPELLRALAGVFPGTLVALDAEGHITHANAHPFGGTLDPVGASWVGLFPQDQQADAGRDLTQVLQSGDALARRVELPAPDGGTRWFTTALGRLDTSGPDAGALALVRDVTGDRQRSEQLVLSDRMASLGLLAAGLAHEINNPLASIIANVHLASSRVQELGAVSPNPEIADLADELRDARDAADRIRALVRDLRLFSRREGPERVNVSVRDVFESTLRIAWNEIKLRARLVKDYGDVSPVLANPSRLGQLFLNVLVNAAHAIPVGKKEENVIRVTTRMDEQGRVAISVRDTGAGMPPEVIDNLFTPFFTTKGEKLGTGLGLTICQRITTELGGRIEVESEVGTGTCITIRLPASTSLSPSLAAAEETPLPPERRGLVLVIDDEPAITLAVQRILGREHDVTAVPSAEAAIELIEAGHRYDVILCDVMMPGMPGTELYVHLEERVPDQAARMLWLTGGAFTPETRGLLAKMAERVIEKPFEPNALRKLVSGLMD